MIHSNASDQRIILQWLSDDHLVEAISTQLSLFNRLGHKLAHTQEGAKLLAYYPSAGFIRYLSFPTEARADFTFCDWDWAKQTALDLNEGSIYTHCCAFDLQGNFFHGGDWEDGGYWSGIDCTGQRINGCTNMPILFDMKCAPDGNRLLLGGRRSYFAIWSFPDLAYKADKTFEIPGGIVSAVAWSGSGTYVAAHSTMGRVLIWDLRRDLPVANIPAPPSHKLLKQKMRFVPGAEHLIWIGMDTCVQLINWRRKLLVHTIPDCRAFDLSPSGEYIAFRREEDTSPVLMALKSLN
jgi:WD40 repeat protein